MEVCIKYKKSNLNKTKLMVIKEFIFFLQKEFPLKDNVTVLFTDKSDDGMTTGSNKLGRIKVLSKGRMLIDVMRTLAHEWVHEHQHQYNRKRTKQDIGGPNENEANIEAGKILKMFAKKYPKKEDKMYE